MNIFNWSDGWQVSLLLSRSNWHKLSNMMNQHCLIYIIKTCIVLHFTNHGFPMQSLAGLTELAMCIERDFSNPKFNTWYMCIFFLVTKIQKENSCFKSQPLWNWLEVSQVEIRKNNRYMVVAKCIFGTISWSIYACKFKQQTKI